MIAYHKTRLTALVTLMLLCTAACGENATSTFETLGKAPPAKDPEVLRIHVGSTANHVAWLSRRGKGYVVAIDGVEGKVYDSADSNGQFSPDGERFLYLAARAPYTNLLVLDGKEIAFDGVANPTFSPDSKQLAYAIRKDLTKSVYDVVIDGPQGRQVFPACSPCFAFSPDGKHFAYFRDPGTFVLDGVPDKTYENARPPIQFSPDGKRVVYMVELSDRHGVLVCDGVEMPNDWQIVFSPDSKKNVYIRSLPRPHPHSALYELWVDGAKVGTYATISPPVFTADGSRMAYRASGEHDSSMAFVVVDGVQGKRYAELSLPMFSPDGKHVAYLVKHLAYQMVDNRNSQKGLIVKDGVEGPIYDICYDPVFSPDSAHMAYRTTQLKSESETPKLFEQIIWDEKPQAVYDHASDPVFSPDSKHIAYCADRGGHAYLVVDGAESDAFDRWFWQGHAFFQSATKVRCMGVKDGMIVRVSRDVP